MLTTLAVTLALFGPGPKTQNPGSQVVSKMLKYYSDAHSITGTINYTATDGVGQAQVVTALQFEKPSRLYIKQYKGGAHQMQWLVTSDGKYFSYDAPENLPGSNKRLVESVLQATGRYDGKKPILEPYTVAQIYAVSAPYIGDRSIPLDIAIGRREDLQHDVLMLMTVQLNGKATVNGEEANVVVGKWRPYGDASNDTVNSPGQYEMVITDEGKLLRYSVWRYVPKDPNNPNDYATLKETWNVNLVLNGKPDASLFRLIR